MDQQQAEVSTVKATKQKDAVFAAFEEVTKDVVLDLSKPFGPQITRTIRASMKASIVAKMLSGEVKNPKNKTGEDLGKYVSVLISTWVRKDSRFTTATNSAPVATESASA